MVVSTQMKDIYEMIVYYSHNKLRSGIYPSSFDVRYRTQKTKNLQLSFETQSLCVYFYLSNRDMFKCSFSSTGSFGFCQTFG